MPASLLRCGHFHVRNRVVVNLAPAVHVDLSYNLTFINVVPALSTSVDTATLQHMNVIRRST